MKKLGQMLLTWKTSLLQGTGGLIPHIVRPSNNLKQPLWAGPFFWGVDWSPGAPGFASTLRSCIPSLRLLPTSPFCLHQTPLAITPLSAGLGILGVCFLLPNGLKLDKERRTVFLQQQERHGC